MPLDTHHLPSFRRSSHPNRTSSLSAQLLVTSTTEGMPSSGRVLKLAGSFFKSSMMSARDSDCRRKEVTVSSGSLLESLSISQHHSPAEILRRGPEETDKESMILE